jgi:hypothetical protein
MTSKMLTQEELNFIVTLGDALIDTVAESGHGAAVIAHLSASLLGASLSCLIQEGDTARVELLCKKMKDIAENYSAKPHVLN